VLQSLVAKVRIPDEEAQMASRSEVGGCDVDHCFLFSGGIDDHSSVDEVEESAL